MQCVLKCNSEEGCFGNKYRLEKVSGGLRSYPPQYFNECHRLPTGSLLLNLKPFLYGSPSWFPLGLAGFSVEQPHVYYVLLFQGPWLHRVWSVNDTVPLHSELQGRSPFSYRCRIGWSFLKLWIQNCKWIVASASTCDTPILSRLGQLVFRLLSALVVICL